MEDIWQTAAKDWILPVAAVFAPVVGVGSRYGRHNPGGCIFSFFDMYIVAF